MLSLDSSSSSCNRQSRGNTADDDVTRGNTAGDDVSRGKTTGDDVSRGNTGGNSKPRKIKRCESMDFKDIMLHSRRPRRVDRRDILEDSWLELEDIVRDNMEQ